MVLSSQHPTSPTIRRLGALHIASPQGRGAAVTGLLCELPAPGSSRRRGPPKELVAMAELFNLTIVTAVRPVSGAA
jgi:hypothetical protein